MPLGDVVAEIAGSLVRFVGEIFVQIVFEVLIKGPGLLLVKVVFPKRSFSPDGGVVILLGLSAWIVVGLVSYAVLVATR